MQDPSIPRAYASEKYITDNNKIRDLVGDVNSQLDIDAGTANYATTHFYLRGTQHDGTAFKEVITMTGDESVASLLDRIGTAYGNTPDNKVVNVTINGNGQIEIEDKIKGSSKLDFHMVAATDFNTAGADDANVTSLEDATTNWDSIGTTDFLAVDSTGGTPNVLITEFLSSGFDTTSTTSIDSVTYDRVAFEQDGQILSSNVPQVVKSDNSFATPTTKLLDVASGSTLDGTSLVLTGNDITGAAYSMTVDLSNAGSTFTVGGSTYTIYNTGVDPKAPISAANPQTATAADEMTYQQLMDVINMVVTGNLPASTASVDAQGVATDYRDAIIAANSAGTTSLSHDGKITFEEIGVTTTQAGIMMYDAVGSDFAANPSALLFNANNALTISDPKTDFFARIDEMIASVDQYKMRADSENGDPRNGGIQNSIQMLDDLMDHLSRQQSQSGVQSQSLSSARDRTEVLIVSSISLRSEVLDTDVAEASMRLQQLSLNMQAIYSTTSKVSKLSLVNYL